MTTEQAIEILRKATENIKATRQEHLIMAKALEVLTTATQKPKNP